MDDATRERLRSAVARVCDKHMRAAHLRSNTTWDNYDGTHAVRLADAVLDALGVEDFGPGWCPIHGTGSCPEQYMLREDGQTAPGYSQRWDEAMRCGRRHPLVRLRGIEEGGRG